MAAVWHRHQLLATIALAVGTCFLVKMGKARYAWITFIHMLFIRVMTRNRRVSFRLRHLLAPEPQAGFRLQGYIDSVLISISSPASGARPFQCPRRLLASFTETHPPRARWPSRHPPRTFPRAAAA